MENFPSNSIIPPTPADGQEIPEKKVERVTSGATIQKKRGIGRKFKELIIGVNPREVGRYVITDVIIPSLKNLFVDTVTKGVNRMTYRNSPPGTTFGGMNLGRQMINYQTPVDRSYSAGMRGISAMLPGQPPYRAPEPQQATSDIILALRDDAVIVLDLMQQICSQYGKVTVADLHELTGLPHSYVENNWGWVNLVGADIRQVREGFLLVLPNPQPLAN